MAVFRNCENLQTITFTGDAPGQIMPEAFMDATVTARYPKGNRTWMEDILLDYQGGGNGKVTWVAYETTTKPETPAEPAVPVTATVTYMDGSRLLKTEAYTVGNGLSTLYQPVKAYHKFLGWYADKNLNTEVTAIGKDAAGDITLYAKWRWTLFYDRDNPRTGDYVRIAIAVMVLSGTGLATALFLYKRKKK